MIREIIREAWRQSPRAVIATVVAVPVFSILAWLWLVVVITAGTNR